MNIHGQASRCTEVCCTKGVAQGALAPGAGAGFAVRSDMHRRTLRSSTCNLTLCHLRMCAAGTRKGEVVVGLHTDRLVVRLGWCGRVVDGPLHRAIRPQDSVWTLADGNTLQVGSMGTAAGRTAPTVGGLADYGTWVGCCVCGRVLRVPDARALPREKMLWRSAYSDRQLRCLAPLAVPHLLRTPWSAADATDTCAQRRLVCLSGHAAFRTGAIRGAELEALPFVGPSLSLLGAAVQGGGGAVVAGAVPGRGGEGLPPGGHRWGAEEAAGAWLHPLAPLAVQAVVASV